MRTLYGCRALVLNLGLKLAQFCLLWFCVCDEPLNSTRNYPVLKIPKGLTTETTLYQKSEGCFQNTVGSFHFIGNRKTLAQLSQDQTRPHLYLTHVKLWIVGYSRIWLKVANEESRKIKIKVRYLRSSEHIDKKRDGPYRMSIPHEFPRFHWSIATGHCVKHYLSATLLSPLRIM